MSGPRRPSLTRTVAAVAILGVLGAVMWRALSTQTNRIRRATISLPAGVSFASNPAAFALSPDGSQLAVALENAGTAQIWTWPLDGVDARPIGGTEGVSSVPAWSPDGRDITFTAAGTLRRVVAAGGPVAAIAELADGSSLDWGEDGTILTATGRGPIRRVTATGGGTTQQISSVYPDEQHEFARFVPGTRRFVFFVHSDELRDGVWLGSLDGGRAVRVVPRGVNATATTDALVYPLDHLVIAQPFNPGTAKFSGKAVTLAENVRIDADTRRSAYAASAVNGVLVFQDDKDGLLHLVRDWTTMVER